MNIVGKAFETVATINSQKQIILDSPLPVTVPMRVRIIILLPEESDIGEKEWLQSASNNPVFDFLKDSEEDIYTLIDGRPLHVQG